MLVDWLPCDPWAPHWKKRETSLGCSTFLRMWLLAHLVSTGSSNPESACYTTALGPMSHHLMRLSATPLVRVCWGDIAVKCINVKIRASERIIGEKTEIPIPRMNMGLFLEPSPMRFAMMRLPTSPRRHCQDMWRHVKTCQDYIRVMDLNLPQAELFCQKLEPDGFPGVFCLCHFGWFSSGHHDGEEYFASCRFCHTGIPETRYTDVLCTCTTCTFRRCSKMFSSFLTNL